MGLLLCRLSMGGENASLVLALHSGQWPETLLLSRHGTKLSPSSWDRALMRGTLRLQTIALGNGETTIITVFEKAKIK